MKLTQSQLVLEYINEFGEITPAKMSGRLYKGVMFGSEASKRARDLRKAGKVVSHKEGKFEVFTLPSVTVEIDDYVIAYKQKGLNL